MWFPSADPVHNGAYASSYHTLYQQPLPLLYVRQLSLSRTVLRFFTKPSEYYHRRKVRAGAVRPSSLLVVATQSTISCTLHLTMIRKHTMQPRYTLLVL